MDFKNTLEFAQQLDSKEMTSYISNIRPYLKKVWFSDKEGGTSNDVLIIRSKGKVMDVFLSFMLRNDSFIEYVMKGAKGVKMPRGDISLMKKYPITFPLSSIEQQKIVDFLSSIEDMLITQSQKIDALKEHKNGLMQQLFPSVSEAP